jgi:hypothetical protein
MGRRTSYWLLFLFLYGLFFWWYTSFDGPMTDEEISDALQALEEIGVDDYQRRTLEHFMRTDTGNDFIMVNLIDLNETPPELPATGPDAKPMDLMSHYMEHMYLAQLKRASHPVFFGQVFSDAVDLSGIESAEHWELAAQFRYRSRRDVVAIIADPGFHERHDYKIAALSKTIAVPVEPSLNPGDFRFIIALVLFSLFALIDLFLLRSGKVT